MIGINGGPRPCRGTQCYSFTLFLHHKGYNIFELQMLLRLLIEAYLRPPRLQHDCIKMPAFTSPTILLKNWKPARFVEVQVVSVKSTAFKDATWFLQVSARLSAFCCWPFRISGTGGWESGDRWDAKRILLDPYAPLVEGRKRFGVRDAEEDFKTLAGSQFWGSFDFDAKPFDWGPDYK